MCSDAIAGNGRRANTHAATYSAESVHEGDEVQRNSAPPAHGLSADSDARNLLARPFARVRRREAAMKLGRTRPGDWSTPDVVVLRRI